MRPLQRAAFEAVAVGLLGLLKDFERGIAQKGAEALLHVDNLVVQRAGLFVAAPVWAEGAHDTVAGFFKLTDDFEQRDFAGIFGEAVAASRSGSARNEASL